MFSGYLDIICMLLRTEVGFGDREERNPRHEPLRPFSRFTIVDLGYIRLIGERYPL